MKKRFLPSSGPDGQNPIQQQAQRNQRVRFHKPKTGSGEKIPGNLTPHPNVTPELEHQQPLPEDRPAGLPSTP